MSDAPCPKCGGSGFDDCDNCGGKGETEMQPEIGGEWVSTECSVCGGTGRDSCTYCNGTGSISTSSEVGMSDEDYEDNVL